jgi:hypothetical protein
MNSSKVEDLWKGWKTAPQKFHFEPQFLRKGCGKATERLRKHENALGHHLVISVTFLRQLFLLDFLLEKRRFRNSILNHNSCGKATERLRKHENALGHHLVISVNASASNFLLP